MNSLKWKKVELEKVAKLIMGQSPDSRFYTNEESDFRFLQGCAEFGKRFPETDVYCSQPTKLAPKDSILFSVRAPVGKLNLADQVYCIGRGLAAIIPHQVDEQFLYQYFLFKNDEIRNQSQGSTFEAINSQQLKKLGLILPECKTTQSKIAAVLSSVDKAIEQTEKLIEKQKRIKRGLLHDLLTKGIDENGVTRSEATHEFKDSPLGRIPKDWNCYSVGKVCEIHNTLRKPISALERDRMKGEFPYYGANGIVDYINEYRVEGEFALIGEDGDHFLKFDDWQMTQLVKGKFNVNNHAHIIKGTKKCLTEWFHHFFCHRDITFYLTRQGAGRFKLNKAGLLNLPILIPQIEEQKTIIRILDNFSNVLFNKTRQFNKFKVIKNGLMQDLLTENAESRISNLL